MAGAADHGTLLMAHDRIAEKSLKRPMGRPRVPSQDARSNRLVTFVTNQELEYLMQITIDEERSMASVIHRIISAHLKEH